MNFLSRFFRPKADPRESLRPLWHRTVAIAREPEWYRDCGVADTTEGRFDMVSTVTAMVMLRMEADPELAPLAGPFAEWFVEDMDGQLRQSGVGDLVVGKKIGKLMSTLGGRLGAYRTALAGDREALENALIRNVTLADETRLGALASRMEQLRARLAAADGKSFREGKVT